MFIFRPSARTIVTTQQAMIFVAESGLATSAFDTLAVKSITTAPVIGRLANTSGGTYYFGSSDKTSTNTPTTGIYKFQNNTFSSVASQTTGLYGPTAGAIGSVAYLYGGWDGSGSTAYTSSYNGTSFSTLTGDLHLQHRGVGYSRTRSKNVLFGGLDASASTIIKLHDGSSYSTSSANLNSVGSNYGMACCSDVGGGGSVTIFGGMISNAAATSVSSLTSGDVMASELQSLPSARRGAGAATWSDGYAYIFGGVATSSSTKYSTIFKWTGSAMSTLSFTTSAAGTQEVGLSTFNYTQMTGQASY